MIYSFKDSKAFVKSILSGKKGKDCVCMVGANCRKKATKLVSLGIRDAYRERPACSLCFCLAEAVIFGRQASK
jgi:hypothetical protein